MNDLIQKYRSIGFTLLVLSVAPLMAHAGDREALLLAQDIADNRANIVDVTPSNYEVLIDDPSGFAFIKTPSGWKYVRQLDRTQLNTAHTMQNAILPGLLSPAAD
jgi:hypothetical protein